MSTKPTTDHTAGSLFIEDDYDRGYTIGYTAGFETAIWTAYGELHYSMLRLQPYAAVMILETLCKEISGQIKKKDLLQLLEINKDDPPIEEEFSNEKILNDLAFVDAEAEDRRKTWKEFGVATRFQDIDEWLKPPLAS